MDCEAYKKQISMMIDGELNPSAEKALRVHLENCSDCRQFCHQLTDLGVALRLSSPALSTPFLATRIKERLLRRNNWMLQDGLKLWTGIPAMAIIALLALGLGNMAGKSITELFSNGQIASTIELIAPDSDSSLSDALLELGMEENHK
jgi:predicted anti-sigma-YlaC factor YlaD